MSLKSETPAARATGESLDQDQSDHLQYTTQSEMLNHIEWWHGDSDGTQFISVSSLDPKGGRGSWTDQVQPNTVDGRQKLAQWAYDRRDTHNLYFSLVAQTDKPAKGRGKAATATNILPGFWGDIDCRQPELVDSDGNEIDFHSKAEDLPAVDKALELLESFPFEPSRLIWSGHGFQAYWKFGAPAEVTPEQLAQWQTRCEILNRQAGIIAKLDSVSDKARVFRLPGSKNFKKSDLEGVEPALCRVEMGGN